MGDYVPTRKGFKLGLILVLISFVIFGSTGVMSYIAYGVGEADYNRAMGSDAHLAQDAPRFDLAVQYLVSFQADMQRADSPTQPTTRRFPGTRSQRTGWMLSTSTRRI